MQIVLLAVIAGVPLILMPGIFFHFNTTPKVALLLFAVPVLFVFCKQHVKNIRSLCFVKEGRIYAMLLAALWIASGLSVMVSTNPELSVHGSLWRRSGWLTQTALLVLAIFIAAWLSGEAHRLLVLIRAIAVTGSVAAIYGIFQYFGHDLFQAPGTYQAGDGSFRITRPPGTIGHADYFASWLIMILFPIAALTVLEQNRLMRIASRVACAVIAAAILCTGTRAAWLGLLVGLVTLLAMKSFRVTRASWVAAAAVAVAIVVFTMSPAGARLRARLHWSRDDARGGARMLLWRDSMRMAADKPWLGFGQETFTTEFPRFASVDLARAYPDFYQESPHNLFLDALDSQGLLGLSCLAGLIVLGIFSGWRALQKGNPIAELLLAGFVATLVCLQFTVLVAATSLYFYLFIGMLVSLRATPLPPTQRVAVPPGYSIAYWVSAAVSLLLPFFAVRLILADRSLAVVQLSHGGGGRRWRCACLRGRLAFDAAWRGVRSVLFARDGPVGATLAFVCDQNQGVGRSERGRIAGHHHGRGSAECVVQSGDAFCGGEQ